ncbi:hypothetical protein Scel_24780 [Streptomyces cellostaticus]|nr:hypothetical protein Scel_24780 [Streptomyces cellostaticus]
MRIRTALGAGLGGAVLTLGTVALPAQAVPGETAHSTQASMITADPCPNGGSYWADWAGGRGRGHYKCEGFRVRLGIHCTDGHSYWSGGPGQPYTTWRLNYNRVECPTGYSTTGTPSLYVR